MPQMPTPDQVVNPSIVFSDVVLEATRNFARSRPWQGNVICAPPSSANSTKPCAAASAWS